MFTHPPLEEEGKKRLQNARASFAQRVAEARASAKAGGASSSGAAARKRAATEESPPELGDVPGLRKRAQSPEVAQESAEQAEVMAAHMDTLMQLRIAARNRRQDLVHEAKKRGGTGGLKLKTAEEVSLQEDWQYCRACQRHFKDEYAFNQHYREQTPFRCRDK